MNLDLNFTPYVIINLKCIINIKVSHNTIKLLEDNTGENLWYLGLSEKFLDMILKEWSTKEKNWWIWFHQN